MKKFNKIISFCLMLTLVAGIGSVAFPATSISASAKIAKQLPNSITKTWYTTGRKSGATATATTKFSKRNFKITIKVASQKQTVSFKIDKIIKYSNTKYTLVSKKEGNMTFRLLTKKFNGKKYQVLSANDGSLNMFFFTTPAQAKASGYNFMR